MHKILTVRKPPAGFGEETVALVTFGYAPTEFDPPVKFFRTVKRGDGKEATYKQYDVALVSGAALKFKFCDVPVVRHEKGIFLQMRDIDIPREVKSAVATEAVAQAGKLTDDQAGDPAPYVESDKDIPF